VVGVEPAHRAPVLPALARVVGVRQQVPVRLVVPRVRARRQVAEPQVPQQVMMMPVFRPWRVLPVQQAAAVLLQVQAAPPLVQAARVQARAVLLQAQAVPLRARAEVRPVVARDAVAA
jgi:hypothetical protein